MENKLDEKLINHILKNLKEDYKIGHCYREDSVKACLYFSIRNYFLKKNEKTKKLENKIFVYPEVRNFLYKKEDEKTHKQRFDLVISKGYLENFNKKETNIYGYEGIFDIIEIKYINGKKSQILESLETDFVKLAKLDETKDIGKSLFFIFEHKSEKLDELQKEINENFKNNKIKIFGLFVDLDNSYQIETFKSWEK